MKHFKFISLIILFLLSFLGSTEFYQYADELSNGHTQDVFLGDVPQVEPATLSMSNDVDIHFIAKQNLKNRTGNSVSNIYKNVYYSDLIPIAILKNGLIYGAATIYKVQLHPHLHLYQLF